MKTIKFYFLFMMIGVACYGHIKLPALISDGMVLQRRQPIQTWGWGNKGERINLAFKGKNYSTITNTSGKWQITLPAMEAGGPYVMTINTIAIKDILIGEVWLCSGQSNMEFTMQKAKDKYAREIAVSKNDNIRQFLVKREWDYRARTDVNTQSGWKSADPQNVLSFTAVGYFFAKEIWEKYKVPIGLIHSSFGGTPIGAWMSEKSLTNYPKLIERIHVFKDSAMIKKTVARNKSIVDDWYLKINNGDAHHNWAIKDLNEEDWKSINVPGYWEEQGFANIDGAVWFRKEIDLPQSLLGKDAILNLGMIIDDDITYINGIQIGATQGKGALRKYTIPGNLLQAGRNVLTVKIINRASSGGFTPGKTCELVLGEKSIPLAGFWKAKVGFSSSPLALSEIVTFAKEPSVLYNAMIAGTVPYTIKGVLWYQGENNAPFAKDYQILFPTMITDWRSKWGQGDFPFLFVQLAGYLAKADEPQESTWAELREAQMLTLKVQNTAMAVAHDIGEWNDIHPLNKLDVGKRLALAARKIAYGENSLVYTGPLYKNMAVKNGQIEIEFAHIGGGLTVKGGGELKHFAIAGADKKFVWANAVIVGNKVRVWSDKITEPVAVRYAWAFNPEGANLYNKEGLPASSFRTDKWSKSK